ncbi:MAG TPA: DPP IV N-terminal domain-containing protein, partial [Phnomibacter sp.]|nr:DPP IV N-terminal domain-containing protein [Phnomibacter sp.]
MHTLRLLTCITCLCATGVLAQQPGTVVTASHYAQAQKMLPNQLSRYLYRASVQPNWLPDGRFYYRVNTPAGEELVMVDPAKATRTVLPNAEALPPEARATAPGGRRRGSNVQIPSPDGTKMAFIRNWNLWVKEVATGKETPLTTDGIENFGYATHNAGWVHSDMPVLLWSADGKKIATFQQDDRLVNDMYLVRTKVGPPELEKWKYPLAGDKEVKKIYRVIIEVDQPKLIRLHMGADAHRSTLCDDIACDGSFTDNQWNDNGTQLAFVSTPRDHKAATLRIANAATGEVRTVYSEVVKTQYESGQGAVNWKVLFGSNEFIWYSEKTDWGHLYLHDLTTGQLKNPITSGNFVVTRIMHIDEKARQIYFVGKGREAGRNPYYNHLYRVDFTGKNLQLLTPEDADHQISWSPNRQYFVDNFGHPHQPTTSLLR